MDEFNITSFLSKGFLILLTYIIISNTLWLLLGSKLIQYLPGVNIKGINGTLKIATLIILSLIGIIIWVIKIVYSIINNNFTRPTLNEEISKMIKSGAKLFYKIRHISNG